MKYEIWGSSKVPEQKVPENQRSLQSPLESVSARLSMTFHFRLLSTESLCYIYSEGAQIELK
jgi:hypothetical protein